VLVVARVNAAYSIADGDLPEQFAVVEVANPPRPLLEKEVLAGRRRVRVGAMRCHAQGLTIKLTRDVPEDEICDMLASANEWVSVVGNTQEESVAALTPAAVSGTLGVPIGRVHKMRLGAEYLAAFTVGDQLLWGAAEPVRRMLRIALEHSV